MELYLLDTTVLIDIQRRFVGSLHWVQHRVLAGDRLGLTPPVVAEFLSGIPLVAHQQMVEVLSAYELLALDWSDAQLAGKLMREYREKGRSLALSDTLTGACAIQHGWRLATSNSQHFPYIETVDPRTAS